MIKPLIDEKDVSPENLRFVKEFVEYLVKFICTHRNHRAYHGWSVDSIRAAVAEGLENKTLLLGMDPKYSETPAGIITCVKEEEDMVIRVTGLIILKRSRKAGIIGTWMKQLNERYPNYNLESRRHGKNCEWQTKRSTKLIQELGL